MSEEEYLKARIKDLEKNVKKLMISEKHRRNQLVALRYYKNQLERLQNYYDAL